MVRSLLKYLEEMPVDETNQAGDVENESEEGTNIIYNAINL